MELNNNIGLDIAIGLSANSKVWKNERWEWEGLVERLSKATVTPETHKQFIQANKDEQGKIKDVGGFVGGYLNKGRRTKSSVLHRQLLTLDIDFSHEDFWWDFTMLFDCAAVLHSTHKSVPNKPRHRLIIPLNREVSQEEYEPIARKVAEYLNIELFDQSTFEPNRFMFWPSVSSDIDYYFEYQDGPILDADEILSKYDDWQNINEWPKASTYDEVVRSTLDKQEDPIAKSGIIGSFCKAFTIQAAIEKFLPDIYEKVDDNRYTYIKGSTAAGAICYDDKFIYSHHCTDPAGGRLCNAFDLVRIHKFGYLDSSSNDAKASLKAMEQFAAKDKDVLRLIASEKLSQAKNEFAEPLEDEDYNEAWVEQLEANKNGEYTSTSNNLNLIIQNDKNLRKAFKLNSFDKKRYIMRSMPWRKIQGIEPMRDVDYSGIRNYIECIYGITSSQKIDDAIAIAVEKFSFHPIRDYINNLNWDGTHRIDSLLIDYFGADDSLYTRASIRKALCAAVARVFNPGTKYDMVLVLVGPQGTYKSTFFKRLGMAWFSDTFSTFQGKESFEQLQGAWLIEMAELSGLKKAEVEQVKQYISKCEDMFRPAYGRTIETYKRQCVFFGTTNNMDFLKDPTGNRRFNPVDAHIERRTKHVIYDLTQSEVDQIWAEAYVLWKNGETLYFDDAEDKLARAAQAAHSSQDERLGLVDEFLNTLLPEDWYKKDLYERRQWLNDPLHKKGTKEREYVCIAEIWCECLGNEKENMSRYNTREINDMLRVLGGWEFVPSTRKFDGYGKQKHYKRIKTN